MSRCLFLTVSAYVRINAAHVKGMRQGAGRKSRGMTLYNLDDLHVGITGGALLYICITRRWHVVVSFLNIRFAVFQLIKNK